MRTVRLLLRLPTLGDVPDLVRLLRKREVRRLIPIRYLYTHVEARSFVRKARELYRAGHGFLLAITRTSDGAYVGGVGLDGFRPRAGWRTLATDSVASIGDGATLLKPHPVCAR